MIIGIDASRANKKNRTGTEWYSYYLIKKLLELDQRNKYWLYTKNSLLSDFCFFGQNFENKILKWPWPLWTQARLSAEMFGRQPDVLFVPAHTIPIIHPFKTVTTCHDVGFEEYPEIYSAKELAYHRCSMRLAVRKAAHIITVSEFSKRQILKYYKIKENKITIIPISYDSRSFNKQIDLASADKILSKYGLSSGKNKIPYLFYIGRLESKKNTARLIAAFKILKSSSQYSIPHKLVLCGAKGTGYQKIALEIEKLGKYKDDVITPGWVEQKDVPILMSKTDVFVFPSLYEGFGIPLLEAFACGVPVAASRIASIPEIAAGAAKLFNPYCVEDMAESVYKLIVDKFIRDEYIKKGYNQIKEFSWKKCAYATLDILQNV